MILGFIYVFTPLGMALELIEEREVRILSTVLDKKFNILVHSCESRTISE